MSKRILVVDDDRSVRWLLQELLEDEAYEVDLATDGQDALEKLDQQRSVYDVIVLDVTMPRMDGLQFVRAMRQRTLDVLPSIIALSADVVALQQVVRMGISNSLSKPFDLDALLELVRLSARSKAVLSQYYHLLLLKLRSVYDESNEGVNAVSCSSCGARRTRQFNLFDHCSSGSLLAWC